MTALVLGLVIFLGVHSTRILADDWRSAQVARIGLGKWKGIYSVLSIVGFVLLVYGYGLARQSPVVLWNPPVWTRHLASPLTLLAFILFAAAKGPVSHFKSAIGHPMVAGLKVWAFAHLIANGNLADVVLFGAFFVWSIVDFAASRRRDRRTGTTYPPGSVAADVKVIVIGTIAWAVFAFWLHAWLIGVNPFS